MTKLACVSVLCAFLLGVSSSIAGTVVEPNTGMEYPDEITIETPSAHYTLKATGVGIREKTIFKVNVYVIVSYIESAVTLQGDLGEAIINLDAAKRLQMDLVRGFSRDKLINAFREVIDKNYSDNSAFAADMDIFFAYFDRDARDKDQIIFEYLPGQGLTTSLNGEVKGVITNFAFTRALWTVWFGEKPASDGLKRDLLAAITPKTP
jgi:hypothetical protein